MKKRLSLIVFLLVELQALCASNVTDWVLRTLPDFVDMPTNRVVLGVELGSAHGADGWVKLPVTNGFGSVFEEFICDRSPVSQRICGFRFFARQYEDHELTLKRDEDIKKVLAILRDVHHLDMKCIKKRSQEELRKEFDECARRGRNDATVWAEMWRGFIKENPKSTSYVTIELYVPNYQKGKGCISLCVSDRDWEYVYFLEQELKAYIEDAGSDEDCHEYQIPKSIIAQRYPICYQGWAIYREERMIGEKSPVKFFKREYKQYLDLIAAINQFERQVAASLPEEKAEDLRIDAEIRPLSNQGDVLEEKVTKSYDTMIVVVTNAVGCGVNDVAKLRDAYVRYVADRIQDGKDLEVQIGARSLARHFLRVSRASGFYDNMCKEDRAKVGLFIKDCSDWITVNEQVSKLLQQKQIRAENRDKQYGEFVNKLKDFSELADKASSRTVSKKRAVK